MDTVGEFGLRRLAPRIRLPGVPELAQIPAQRPPTSSPTVSATEQKTTIFNGPWRGEPRDRDSSVGGRAAAREHSTADREAMIDDHHLQLARDSHGSDRPRDRSRHRPTGRYFGGGSADDHRGALVRGDGLGLPREAFGAPLASP